MILVEMPSVIATKKVMETTNSSHGGNSSSNGGPSSGDGCSRDSSRGGSVMESMTCSSEVKNGDNGGVPENSPLNAALQIVDKKVRNLEKRKGKLDGYRADYERGKELNDDQKAAIAKYEEVSQNLDFARELSGQFKSLAIDEEKNRKKQMKKETMERSKLEVAKVAYILQVKDILVKLKANSSAKSDCLEGSNDAPKLSQVQMNQLEDLTELLLGSTSSTSPNKKSKKDKSNCIQGSYDTVTDHYLGLYEGKNKKPLSTSTNTYQDYKNLIQILKTSKYVESLPLTPVTPPPVAPVEPEVVVKNEPVQVKEEPSSPPPAIIKNEPIEPEEIPEDDLPSSSSSSDDDNVTVTVNGGGSGDHHLRHHHHHLHHHHHQQQQQHQQDNPNVDPREVIPSGSYNFLQDSQIDPISMDPAVIGVHHSPPQQGGGQPGQQQAPHGVPTQTFTNQIYMTPTTLAQIQHQQQAAFSQAATYQHHAAAMHQQHEQLIKHQLEAQHQQSSAHINKKPAAPGFGQQQSDVTKQQQQPQQQPTKQVKSEQPPKDRLHEEEEQQQQQQQQPPQKQQQPTAQPSKPTGYAAAAAGFRAMPPLQQNQLRHEEPTHIEDWSADGEIEENRENSNHGNRKDGRGGSRGGRGGFKGRKEGGEGRGYRGRGRGGEGGFRGRGGDRGRGSDRGSRGDRRGGGRGGRGSYRGGDKGNN